MVKVRVPATSANMGSGFDTFGIALNVYNEIQIEPTDGSTEIKLINGVMDKNIKNNLTYNSIIKTYEYCKQSYTGFKIDMSKCDIPMSRGLGSSAACIVGGIFGANALLGNKLSVEDMLSIAVGIEGHPDNVAPALIGGMLVSVSYDNDTIYSKVNIKSNLKYAVMIPEFRVSTSNARKVVPDTFSRKDAVFNISRSAMLVAALNNGENNKLRYAFEDKIHQPYRKKFISNIDEIFEKSKEFGAYGEFISGSGSTLVAVIDETNREFCNKMSDFLKGLNDKWRVLELERDTEGTTLI